MDKVYIVWAGSPYSYDAPEIEKIFRVEKSAQNYVEKNKWRKYLTIEERCVEIVDGDEDDDWYSFF